MRRRGLLAAAAGAIVAIALAGGIAWAAIPESGVIQSCYDTGGNLKVVSAFPCPKGYTPLAWNQQGNQGTQGPQGIQGSAGKDGFNGTNGQDGEDGVSVTSESEPVGAYCANGGSKFTAANGVTYACNGATGPSGPSGPPGGGGGSGACSSATVNGGTNGVAGFGYASLVRQASPSDDVNANADTFTCVGRLSNLSLTSSVAPGGGYDLRVVVNGGATLLRCDIRGDETTCTNTLNALDVNPGDEISVLVSRVVVGTPVASFTWSATVSPPAVAYP